ncbi:MAG: hypothetical protein ACP5SB_04185 [Caldisericaceae bacterium]
MENLKYIKYNTSIKTGCKCASYGEQPFRIALRLACKPKDVVENCELRLTMEVKL